MSADRTIENEHRTLELEAASRDEQSALCDMCHERSGSGWIDQQWLCGDCQRISSGLIDSEFLPSPQTPQDASRSLLRRRGFGGSDAGVLAGVDPYRDLFSLVVEKQGQLSPLPPSMRMVMGKFLERGIIQGYEFLTGHPTQFSDELHIHQRIPHMLASPDAFCLDEPRGVDAKLSGPDQAWQWLAGPPPHYVAQCQWYMKFFGFSVWDIACWNGSDLKVYTVEADPIVQDTLLRIAHVVWQRYVVTGELPVIGISESSTRYLVEHHPRHTAPLRDATPEEAELLAEYGDVRRVHEEISDRRAQIEQRLKLCVGDAEGIRAAGYKFTWKATKDSHETDWQAIAQTLLQRIHPADGEILIAENTRFKTGSRRIHYSQPKGGF